MSRATAIPGCFCTAPWRYASRLGIYIGYVGAAPAGVRPSRAVHRSASARALVFVLARIVLPASAGSAGLDGVGVPADRGHGRESGPEGAWHGVGHDPAPFQPVNAAAPTPAAAVGQLDQKSHAWAPWAAVAPRSRRTPVSSRWSRSIRASRRRYFASRAFRRLRSLPVAFPQSSPRSACGGRRGPLRSGRSRGSRRRPLQPGCRRGRRGGPRRVTHLGEEPSSGALAGGAGCPSTSVQAAARATSPRWSLRNLRDDSYDWSCEDCGRRRF